MTQVDLTSALFLDQVDPQELAQIVLEFFSNAVFKSAKEVFYHRPGEPPAIRFLYRDDRIDKIEGGPGLRENDVSTIQEKIKTDLLEVGRKVVCRVILFSDYSLNGYIRIRDFFQICPVPPIAPRPTEFWEKNHPFLMEFIVTASPNKGIQRHRSNVLAQRLSLLLNAIAIGRIRPRTEHALPTWVKIVSENTQYALLPQGYSYDGFETWSELFSSCEGFSEISLRDSSVYFGQQGLMTLLNQDLPNIFQDLFLSFFTLSRSLQEKFTRAAYWFRLAQHEESYSALFLHLIQCVETLLPPAESGQVCATCKRNIGKSSTQRFTEFLDALVPRHPELTSARNKLYGLRSDLSHGWDLMAQDLNEFIGSKSSQQTLILVEAFELARLALINWLIQESASPITVP